MKPREERVDQAVTRRTLLDWLGRGAALALASPLLNGCATGHARAGAGADSGQFSFKPGEGSAPIYADWRALTVDPQDPAALISSWQLRVDGMVREPRSYSFADLLALPRQDQVTDFHCVEGWSVLDVPWSGVSLARLLDAAGTLPGASHVTFHTFGDVYDESLPLSVAREPKTLMAFGAGGQTLPLDHGFPLRLVVPRLLGYKNAKYVYRLEVTDHPVDGYWVARGYSYSGEVPAERLRTGKY